MSGPVVVADASPLIALAAIGRLGLLQDLFGSLLIPPAVRREIVEYGSGRPGAEEVAAANWIREAALGEAGRVAALGLSASLDAGEAEALAPAEEIGAELVLMDERRGRKRAEAMGIRVLGAVGVLKTAKRRGLIESVRPGLDALTAIGLYLSEDVVADALKGE